MEKILNNLNIKELRCICDFWKLANRGTKADRLIIIRQEIVKRFPEENPDVFDLAGILEEAEEAQQATNEHNKERIDNISSMLEQIMSQISPQRNHTPVSGIPPVPGIPAQNANQHVPRNDFQQRLDAPLQQGPTAPLPLALNHQEPSTSKFKLPPFWKNEPELWFDTIEESFRAHNIFNHQLRFHKILESLEQSIISHIANVIRSSSCDDKYTEAKRQLISIFKTTEEKKFRRLLEEIELGDRKPSTLYREMSELACNNITDEMLVNLWIKKLPQSISQQVQALRLVIQPSDILSAADTLFDNAPVGINEIRHKNLPEEDKKSDMQKMSENFLKLQNQIQGQCDKMQEQIENFISHSNTDRSRLRENSSRRFSRQRSNSRNSSNGVKNPLCFYHKKFGSSAFKCRKPCSMEGQIDSKNE